ncbi:baseplate J/gp47 family protein [Brevibacillus sp. HB1.4B]|uniref:baseplate J/gp47 family protein n=1 Tax=Brevibacillus sp. HB1.4B TaxID=2738845 RepID=UPI00156B8463|nr:baseplate J/gp47 family protein [Brevibacillus sp. HB1.4B]NRS15811.1 baseplate J/gp47 family protein [Brevibacillus sp. HB1.4B]
MSEIDLSFLEGSSFGEILYEMLLTVPEDLDRSEGSIIYDALAPIAKALFKHQTERGKIIEQAFAVTATRKYLELMAIDYGLAMDKNEPTEDLRNRVLRHKRNPERGGALSDYERWAHSIPGVNYVRGLNLIRGIGTVDLVVGGTIPNLLETVQEVIDRKKTPGLDVIVRLVSRQTVPIEVAVTGLDKEKARQAILTYTSSIGVGGTLFLAQIFAALVGAGATDAKILLPTSSVTLRADAQIDPVVTII